MTKKPTKAQIAALSAELFQAIEEKDHSAVREKIRAGTPPDAIGPERVSALFKATMKNDLEMMRVLLDEGANVDFGGLTGRTVRTFATPLNYACKEGRRAAISLLLDHGADPAVPSKGHGANAVYWMFEHGGLVNSKAPDWDEFAEVTLARMLDTGLPPYAMGRNVTNLHAALIGKAPLSTVTMLLERGADPQMPRAHDGSKFIHVAAIYDRPDVVRCLVARGVDVNETNAEGRTALSFVEGPEMVDLLVELGAEVNHQDNEGDTALHVLQTFPTNPGPGYERILRLLAAGASPEIPNKSGLTPLGMAKRRRKEEVLPALQAAVARAAIGRVVDVAAALKKARSAQAS